MKPFSKMALVLLIVLPASNIQLFGQSTTHKVTLHVNTSDFDETNHDTTCHFGQAEGILNKDHTIEVSVGDFIIWDAVSSNAPDTDEVWITSIIHESGINVLGQNSLKDAGHLPGVVIGRVSSGEPGQIQKYSIEFKVFNNGTRRRGTFLIDPKIQVNN